MLSYEELFNYFKRARGKLIEALERLPEEEFTKARGLSLRA
ncbi:MAG: hypothetical protein ABSG74_11600 [Candidatus Bathyarchaeia archaeon]